MHSLLDSINIFGSTLPVIFWKREFFLIKRLKKAGNFWTKIWTLTKNSFIIDFLHHEPQTSRKSADQDMKIKEERDPSGWLMLRDWCNDGNVNLGITAKHINKIFSKIQLVGSESIEGLMGYWLRGHEGERNNCFSKI